MGSEPTLQSAIVRPNFYFANLTLVEKRCQRMRGTDSADKIRSIRSPHPLTASLRFECCTFVFQDSHPRRQRSHLLFEHCLLVLRAGNLLMRLLPPLEQ